VTYSQERETERQRGRGRTTKRESNRERLGESEEGRVIVRMSEDGTHNSPARARKHARTHAHSQILTLVARVPVLGGGGPNTRPLLGNSFLKNASFGVRMCTRYGNRAPATSVGCVEASVLPMPSCPSLLAPQHLTPPPVTMAHVCHRPMAMATVAIPGRGSGWWGGVIVWGSEVRMCWPATPPAPPAVAACKIETVRRVKW
jgi:hypothetical protein